MRTFGSAKVLEARRLRALKLLDTGLSLNEVARKIGCAPSSVMRWRNLREAGGAAGLKVKRASGRPPRLSAVQSRELVAMLLRGAIANGYRTELWTTARIAETVAKRFAVRYHPDHVGRMLHRLGWSAQKSERRAIERNEEEVERWKRTTWRRVEKAPQS